MYDTVVGRKVQCRKDHAFGFGVGVSRVRVSRVRVSRVTDDRVRVRLGPST